MEPIKPVMREPTTVSRAWILLSLLLLVAAAGAAVFGIIEKKQKSNAEQEVVAMEQELQQMEEMVASMSGEEELEETDAPNHVLKHADIVFEYPSDVELLFDSQPVEYPEIYPLMTLEFLTRGVGDIGDPVWGSNGLTMDYGYQLSSEVDGVTTFDELLAYWSAVELLPEGTVAPGIVDVEVGTVDDLRYVKIVEIYEALESGGLGGPESVTVNKDRTRVYIDGLSPEQPWITAKFTSRGFFSAELTLETILETVNFYPGHEDVQETE